MYFGGIWKKSFENVPFVPYVLFRQKSWFLPPPQIPGTGSSKPWDSPTSAGSIPITRVLHCRHWEHYLLVYLMQIFPSGSGWLDRPPRCVSSRAAVPLRSPMLCTTDLTADVRSSSQRRLPVRNDLSQSRSSTMPDVCRVCGSSQLKDCTISCMVCGYQSI